CYTARRGTQALFPESAFLCPEASGVSNGNPPAGSGPAGAKGGAGGASGGIVLTGSIAYDYLMSFPGRFRDHILPDRLDRLSLSFLVDSLVRRRGGIAANIAYTLALLGERPMVMATVGEDFEDYRGWLEARGVDTSAVRAVPGVFTASFFVNTDQAHAQIASFYTGAMAHAVSLRFAELPCRPSLAVISANDPGAMIAYVRECLELGMPYFYDPGQQIVRLDSPALVEGIMGARAFFVNDYELGLVQEKTGLGMPELTERLEWITITRGDQGADIFSRDGAIHVPAIVPDVLVDPTGVGDAFRGGFFKGYLRELPLERCGQMGVLAATYCLEHEGTQGHEYDLASFLERFRRHFPDGRELDRLW
ncbi:MAG: carbohydrate kinase family protein, partial [Anaerolineales bacterium]